MRILIDGEGGCWDSVDFKFSRMADVYPVSSDDIEEALNVLRSLSDYTVPSGSSVRKILTDNMHPITLKRSVIIK